MLSLCELRRAVPILETRLANSRAHRFIQPDEYRLLVAFSGGDQTTNLLLSCRPDFARLCTVDHLPEAPAAPPSFAQFLRAHAARARFEGVGLAAEDRQATFRLAAPEGIFRLILSIAGARSNIYLVDAAGRLVHALRPLDVTRRDLRLGEPWIEGKGGPPSEGTDRWHEAPDEEYLHAICGFYDQLERSREAATLVRRIETVLAKEETFLGRKGANLMEDLGQAHQADESRHKGELLKGALHMVQGGADAVTVTDYTTGEPITIPLDPKLSPAENLETYFARYHKESRGVARIEEQLQELQEAQNEIRELQDKARAIGGSDQPDLEAARQLAAHPRIRRLLGRYYPVPKPQKARPVQVQGTKEIPGKLLPKRYRTEEGLEIWVGKSDEGNDYLSTRLARGNDLFFHLEGYPGSHVVLRTGGSENPPSGAVLDACELAVHFSKLKESSRADVHVAAIKNVKKPKGAKPGLVYVLKGKTIHLRRDPKRLRNILSARLDD